MIVAMNPYKSLDLYGVSVMNKYRGENLRGKDNLPPHLYLVAGQAYVKTSEKMRRNKA